MFPVYAQNLNIGGNDIAGDLNLTYVLSHWYKLSATQLICN